MKHKNKLIALVLSVITIVAMFAIANAGSNITGTASATEIKAGETFTFTIAMDEKTISSLGVTVSTTEDLEIVSAKWLQNGMIATFDTNKNKGAFTPGGAQAMSGDIFEVTVKAKKASTTATISVEIIAKNGTNVLFTETTSKQLTVLCANHDFSDFVKDGNNHTRTCKTCGYKESKAHIWDNGAITTEPTCTANGVKTYTCQSCDATKTESVNKLTHEYTDWAQDDNKNHTKSCVHCGDIKNEAHKWGDAKITTNPTCATEGVKSYFCSVCNATKTESIPKTNNHTYTNWYNANDNEHQHKCTVCSKTENKAHDWDAGKVTTPATCDKVGVKTYTCKTCQATKTSEVAKIAHTFDNACDTMCNKCSYTREITHNYSTKWTSDEYDHWHACTVCKAAQSKEMHKDSDWIIDSKATEFKAGSKHIECTICKRVLATESIPATGCKHEYEHIEANAKDATCTEAGRTADTLCSKCNTILTTGEEIPALGHKNEVVDKKDATCTEDGFTGTEKCTVCDAVINEGVVIPATGHTETIVDTKDATCIEEGFTGNKKCTVCGVVLEEGTATPKAEHEYKDGACINCYAKDPNKVDKPEDPDVSTPDVPETPEEPTDLTWLWILLVVVLLGGSVVTGVVIYKKRSK